MGEGLLGGWERVELWRIYGDARIESPAHAAAVIGDMRGRGLTDHTEGWEGWEGWELGGEG